jgi:serine/threonine protein kinase
MTERLGQQLGNYRLIRLLGEGGFAEVYLGEHVYLKTQAAVKVLQVLVMDYASNGTLRDTPQGLKPCGFCIVPDPDVFSHLRTSYADIRTVCPWAVP